MIAILGRDLLLIEYHQHQLILRFIPRWYSWKAWYNIDNNVYTGNNKQFLSSSAIPPSPAPALSVLFNWTYIYDHSPLAKTHEKHIYIVENYPKHIDRLPSNMGEVLDRARDHF